MGLNVCEENGKKSDIERDKYLKNLGINVLRYSNLDVNKNFKGVYRRTMVFSYGTRWVSHLDPEKIPFACR